VDVWWEWINLITSGVINEAVNYFHIRCSKSQLNNVKRIFFIPKIRTRKKVL
jgi:hypothetical protein